MNPLNKFNSTNVFSLLVEFYSANFTEYGVDKSLGENLVNLIWQKKDKFPQESLRKEVKDLFDNVKLQESKTRKEISLLDLFDLSNVNHFVDVGANNLARINEVARKYPQIAKLTAVDVVPQVKQFKDPVRSTYIQINPTCTDYPIKSNSCDFINIEFVLHHFLNEDLIKSQIKTFERILKPGGKILLWEESFEESIDLKNLILNNNKLGIQSNKSLTQNFYKLSQEEKLEFIIVNDWIINVNLDHMQWTGQWKDWKTWVSLFESEGFVLEMKSNLGLRVNGRLKQGVHMLGLFKLVKEV